MSAVKIDLWDLSCINTIQDVINAYNWCVDQFGYPGDVWQYGNDKRFLSNGVINGPHEIEYLIFKDSKDALHFKLAFG